MKKRSVIFFALITGLCVVTSLAVTSCDRRPVPSSGAAETEKSNLEAILQRLRDKDTTVREQAIGELQRYSYAAASTPATDQNGNSVDTEKLTDAEIAKYAAAEDKAHKQFLQKREVVDALRIAIDDSSASVRSKTAILLGNVEAPEAQAALIRHLRSDSSDHVRKVSGAALDWTPNSPAKVAGLLAVLNDPLEPIVSLACASLGRTGDRSAVVPLQKVLKHSSWQVRFNDCEALVNLKAVDANVVRLLEALNRAPEAKEHNEMVRSNYEFTKQFEPEAAGSGPAAHTTSGVLEQARRQLNP